MNAAVTLKPKKEVSPRFKALTSGFGQVIVPAMLIVSGNAAATNLLSHDLLVRLSIVAALVAVACHIIWTFLFYELFKPVNRSLSLLGLYSRRLSASWRSPCRRLAASFQFAPSLSFQ